MRFPDQDLQLTGNYFTGKLKNAGVRISIDGRRRTFDNIFVERFWPTVKYKKVHLKQYFQIQGALNGVGVYMEFYDNERLHQSLKYRTPTEVYFGKSNSRFVKRL